MGYNSNTEDLLAQIRDLLDSAQATMRFGETLTGALTGGTLYRFYFTAVDNVTKITYTNAAYQLQAFDPNTGAVIAIDFLADGDTNGLYTPANSFRLRVTEDMPDGLVIRHCGK